MLRGDYWFAQLFSSRQTRAGAATDLGKNGGKGGLAFRRFGEIAGLGFIRTKKRSAREECLQPVVVALRIIIDPRVIVALGTGKIAAKEKPAGFPGQCIRIALAFQRPTGDRACALMAPSTQRSSRTSASHGLFAATAPSR